MFFRKGGEGRTGKGAAVVKEKQRPWRELLKPALAAPLFYRERRMLHNKPPPKLSGLKQKLFMVINLWVS